MIVLDVCRIAVVAAAVSALPVLPTMAATVTECDQLASHPSDPDKVIRGIPQSELLGWPRAAIAACRQAVATEPGNARVRYLLGRVLFYVGEKAEALTHLEAASQGHHRQGQFVLGLMYTAGVDDLLQADPCRAMELWRDAGSRGHFAARVALGRDLARGQYRECESLPETAVVDEWLAAAATETRDYYQGLLIAWTREVLAAGR